MFYLIELGRVAVMIRTTEYRGSCCYPPRFLRLQLFKWDLELHIGSVKDTLKALRAILNKGE